MISTQDVEDEFDGEGDITVAAALSWSTGNTLTLDAAGDVVVAAPITLEGGEEGAGLSLDAGGDILLADAIVAPESTLTFEASGGDISIQGPITAGGGALLAVSDDDLVVDAAITMPGGSVALDASGGDLTVGAPISVGGGSLDLEADADMLLDGPISAPGGTVDANPDDTLTLGAPVTAPGGVLTFDAADIALEAPITAAEGSLTLVAEQSISIDGAIAMPEGSLTLDGRDNDGAVAVPTIGATASVEVDQFTLENGAWFQVADPLPAFSAENFSIGGNTFLRAEGGGSTAGDPYLIADVFGLQGVGTVAPGGGLDYVLANDVEAAGTSNWNAGAGFVPLGGEGGLAFGGTLDGDGHAITNLTVSVLGAGSEDQAVGLFREIGGGAAIENLALIDLDVAGGTDVNQVGALAGVNAGTVSNVLVTGTVSAIDSTADFDEGVPIQDEVSIGGLVGVNGLDGVISQSASTAEVVVETFGDVSAGGLVGLNRGLIEDSYGQGAVTLDDSPEPGVPTDPGEQFAAGLVGQNAGTIRRAFATGGVSNELADGAPAVVELGGLVASALAPDGGPGTSPVVAGSFWDVERTGQEDSAGGEGLDTTTFQDTEAFVALAGEEGWDFGTVWAPPEPGFDPALYASSPVIFVDLSDATAQYGLQEETALESAAFGGPDLYVFGPDGDEVVLPPATSPGLPDGPVGIYPITVAEPTVASEGGVEYRLVTLDGTLAITEAPLVVRVPDQTKVLGDALDLGEVDFVVEGLVFDDAVTDLELVSAGASADAPIAVSPAPIQVVEVEGVGLGNYEISFELGEVIIEPGPGDPPGSDEPDGLREFFRSAAFQTPGVLLPDPEDVIIVPGVGGGPIREAAATRTDPVTAAEETLAALEGFGAELEAALEACRRSEPTVEAYLDCLGRELDRYAAALDEIALDLPEPLRGVSAIIREASREVSIIREEAVEQLAEAEDDAERERIGQDAIAQARETIRTASIEVQQAIELVFVEEPRLATLYTEQGNAIQAALDSVDTELVLVSGL